MAPPDGLEPTTHVAPQKRWQNWHQNFSQPVTQLLDVWNANPDVPDLETYAGTTRGLQKLIGQAVKDGNSVRALGGGWSFSPVAATDGIIINTKPLNYGFTLAQSAHPQYQGDPAHLFFAQCGMSISELNHNLRSAGKSLKTSGASNGQTIAGALSTGTHGSAIDVGAVPDYVVGLHVVVGPDRHVWLERASAPVIADAVPKGLGAELIRDDQLFNAARVSFGSFGIIHGVLLETAPLFYLQASRTRVQLDEVLWNAMDTLDFTGLSLPRPATQRPFHFQVIINPHDVAGGAYLTVMYKDAEPADDCTPPAPEGKITQGDDALEVMGVIADNASNVTPFVVNQLLKVFMKDFAGVCGTHGEIFGDTTTRGKAGSTALGIPLGRVREAAEVALRANQASPFAGLVAFRYPKASDATLAFTRHEPQTCVLELDGPWSNSTRTFYGHVWRGLDDAGIPYTFHWGKIHALDGPRVRRMYTDAAVDSWLAARKTLLDTPKLRKVFANQWLRDIAMDA